MPRLAVPLGSPDALRQLLASRGIGAADDESLLRIARAPEHKLAVTMLSGWEAAGRSLRPEQRAELSDNRRRIDRYRSTWTVITGAAPGAHLVKGAMIAAHYPPGLLRAAGDMDVICPADQLWRAARALAAQGWQLGAFTIVRARVGSVSGSDPDDAVGQPEISIELNQPSDSADIDEAYGVELRTVDVATSLRMSAWRLSGAPMPPVAASILALAAERWERPFRSRDIYDLAVLCDHLDEAERTSLSAALTITGLWPEMRELSGLLRRSGLRPEPRLPGGRRAAWRARAVRLARMPARWSHPLRILGYLTIATVDTDRGALADRLSRVVHERIGTWRLLRLGLPLFAVPLPAVPPDPGSPGDEPSAERPSGATAELPDGEREPDQMRLVRRGSHLVALTPIGSFLMVAGSCQESWLEEAAAGPREAVPEPAAGQPRG